MRERSADRPELSPLATAGLETIAVLASSEDGQEEFRKALDWAIQGMPAESRGPFLRSLLSTLPASVRLAIVAGVDDIHTIIPQLREKEERPKIIDAIIEQGRKEHEIDFGMIPDKASLRLDLYKSSQFRPAQLPDELKSKPYQTIHLQSMGEGRYVVDNGQDLWVTRGSLGIHSIPSGHILRFGARHIMTQRIVSTVGFGQSLCFADERDTRAPEFFTEWRGRKHDTNGLPKEAGPLSLGEVYLNKKAVFCHRPAKQAPRGFLALIGRKK